MKKFLLVIVCALTFAVSSASAGGVHQSNGDPGGGGQGSTCNYFLNGAVLYLPLAPPPYGATWYRCRENSGPAYWVYSDYYQSAFVNYDLYGYAFYGCCIWGWVPATI